MGGGDHLVLLRLFRVLTISKTPRVHLRIAALSSKKTSHPVPSLLPNIDKFCTPCTGSRNRLSTIHDVILKASESLLILEASSEQTLFWAKLSIALSPIVWFRNLCHSSIWVGSYLKKNMTTTLGISSVTRQRSSPG